MTISRRSLLTSTAFGAGFLLVPGLRSAANAQTAKLVIGNYEAPGLYDQAAQEIVTDRDDGYHNDGNPRHYEWWYFDLFTQSGLKAAVSRLGDAQQRFDGEFKEAQRRQAEDLAKAKSPSWGQRWQRSSLSGAA